MTINNFKKKIFAWDEYEKKFYFIKNNLNINIDELLFIEGQKKILLQNTILFAKGMPYNYGLLWGARGTGKSSLIFTIFNYLIKNHNISLLEIKRNQIKFITSILRKLDNINQKFIIFFDDFSFNSESEDFIIFKNILDGALSKNTKYLYYATSNFRSFIQNKNYNQTNLSMLQKQEVSDNETALSDRFGIWLGFEKFTDDQYLNIVKNYCIKHNINNANHLINKKALQWSLNRGSKSGREAYYFVKSLFNQAI
ncbi:MAG: hypothetical protein CMJ06_04540 [Pelagibacterales bacterium]|nr:hypothetical protein [Pelagibacterales bacterium]OUU61978.1 MAG: hypothetical protein CBC22_05990 [Alphaproteobacteria bacterium TMED62]|tara:strand:+ start:2516 stop:3277 length:762 start_codon:yes stop_codon:yes gene_type:complete